MSNLAKNKLFLPNDHSRFTIRWKKVESLMRQRIAKILREHYSFDKVYISEIQQVSEWEKMSNNFRVAVEVKEKKHYILFRKHIQLSDRKSIAMLDAVISYLGDAGIPIPEIIPTRQGGKSFFLDGNYYTVYKFIPGNHFCGTRQELKLVAESLGCLHRALLIIPCEFTIRKRKKLLPSWTNEKWGLIFKEASKNRTSVDRMLMAKKELILSAMKEAQKLKKVKAKKQVIHGDLHPQNTIFIDGKLKAFLDFENVVWSERIRDVANALHRFVRQYVVHSGGYEYRRFRGTVSLFVATYKKALPLQAREEKLIPAVIMDELLRKLLKDISRHYFSGESRFLVDGKFQEKLMLLEEANYFKFK